MVLLLAALLLVASVEGQTDTTPDRTSQEPLQDVTITEESALPSVGRVTLSSLPEVTTLLADASGSSSSSTAHPARNTTSLREASSTFASSDYTTAPTRLNYQADSRTDRPVTLPSDSSSPKDSATESHTTVSTLHQSPVELHATNGLPDRIAFSTTTQHDQPIKYVDTSTSSPTTGLPGPSLYSPTPRSDQPTKELDFGVSTASPKLPNPNPVIRDVQPIIVATPTNPHIPSNDLPGNYRPTIQNDIPVNPVDSDKQQVQLGSADTIPSHSRRPIYADSRIDTDLEPEPQEVASPDTPNSPSRLQEEPPTPANDQIPADSRPLVSRVEGTETPARVSVGPVKAASVHFATMPPRVVTARPFKPVTTPRTLSQAVPSLSTIEKHQQLPGINKKKKGGIKIKKPKKKDSGMSSLIYIPLMIQAQIIPMMLLKLKFLALKAIAIGKLALLILGLNLLRNAIIGHDNDAEQYEHETLASQHYGYNGGPEYGSWVNRRVGQIPNKMQKYQASFGSHQEKSNSHLKENSRSKSSYLTSGNIRNPANPYIKNFENHPYRAYNRNTFLVNEMVLDKSQ